MKKALLVAALFALPLVASAQGAPSNIAQLIFFIGDTLNRVIPILIALAVVFFFYGLAMYILKPDWKTGKKVMIAGLLGLFVMVSIWGIIRLMQNTLGVTGAAPATVPQVPLR